MVSPIVGRDGRIRPWGIRVLELGNQAVAFQVMRGASGRRTRSASDKGRAVPPAAHKLPRGNARAGNQERHPRGTLPQRVFPGDPLFTQVPPMVRPENNDRLIAPSRGVEGIKHPPDLAIHKAGTGQIGPDQRTPLVGSLQPREPGLGQLPVQEPRESRHIVAVVFLHFRQRRVSTG